MKNKKLISKFGFLLYLILMVSFLIIMSMRSINKDISVPDKLVLSLEFIILYTLLPALLGYILGRYYIRYKFFIVLILLVFYVILTWDIYKLLKAPIFDIFLCLMVFIVLTIFTILLGYFIGKYSKIQE
jgi:hypothetical protein